MKKKHNLRTKTRLRLLHWSHTKKKAGISLLKKAQGNTAASSLSKQSSRNCRRLHRFEWPALHKPHRTLRESHTCLPGRHNSKKKKMNASKKKKRTKENSPFSHIKLRNAISGTTHATASCHSPAGPHMPFRSLAEHVRLEVSA